MSSNKFLLVGNIFESFALDLWTYIYVSKNWYDQHLINWVLKNCTNWMQSILWPILRAVHGVMWVHSLHTNRRNVGRKICYLAKFLYIGFHFSVSERALLAYKADEGHSRGILFDLKALHSRRLGQGHNVVRKHTINFIGNLIWPLVVLVCEGRTLLFRCISISVVIYRETSPRPKNALTIIQNEWECGEKDVGSS